MTYCPDEPRGWTPRLTIYDNELAYSCNTKVASSYNTVILVEDDTLVDQQSRSRRGGESRCEIHLILELLDRASFLLGVGLLKHSNTEQRINSLKLVFHIKHICP